jgi:fido (protein-threonine AMPylation protein)
LFINRDLCSITISQKFSLYDYQGQIKPLLPSEAKLQMLAIAASHQRLAWAHPFRDGNGRVARRHTQPK